MTIADYIQVLLLLVVICQLGWAIFTFRKGHALHLEEIKADHDRRKKEATVAYVNSIREQYRTIRLRLDDKFGEGNTINIDQIDKDAERNLIEILSLLEHLSAGVNTNVFDFDLIYLMSSINLCI